MHRFAGPLVQLTAYKSPADYPSRSPYIWKETIVGLTLWRDRSGRPHLAFTDDRIEHNVILLEVAPTVVGWCATCASRFADPDVADRKARICKPMVQYLSEVNRNRQLRLSLIGEIQDL